MGGSKLSQTKKKWIGRVLRHAKSPCSYGRTITGSFDITVTPHYLNPRAASAISLSCFAIRDVSSMLGNCSAEQSSRMDASRADSMAASQCWTHRLKQNTN